MAVAVDSRHSTPYMNTSSGNPTQQAMHVEELPSSKTLQKSARLPVTDAQGRTLRFEQLYTTGRVLIIFIRHFFCGMCQDFLRDLCSSLTPQTLKNAKRPSSIAIVGCGQPELIDDYASKTHCSFPIYVDPSRKLYDTLGMTSTLNQGDKRPSYQAGSILTVAGKSFVQGITAGTGAWKGGSISQIGGEFLFENGRMTWCHKMKYTRDHTEVKDLKILLGI